MEPLRGERQEWREHRLEVVDAPESDVQHGAGTRAIRLDRVPGLLGAEVDVDPGRHRHHVPQPNLKTRLAQTVLAHDLKLSKEDQGFPIQLGKCNYLRNKP